MTRRKALAENGTGIPRRIIIQVCDLCGTVSAVSTSNGTGLWACDPCETEHFNKLTKGSDHV